jgi:hypothetical protein
MRLDMDSLMGCELVIGCLLIDGEVYLAGSITVHLSRHRHLYNSMLENLVSLYL